MENQTPAPNSENNLESLEGSGTVVEQSAAPLVQTDATPLPDPAPELETPRPRPSGSGSSTFARLRRRFAFLNVYLLIFLLVLLIAAVASIIAYNSSKRTASDTAISSQALDQKALEQLANTDTNVGSSAQILNVQSNAVFAGKVLVRDTLEVAGQLQVGGSLSLAELNISGNGSIGKDLAVAGDTALQGVLTVQKNLNVTGNGNFGGTVSAKQLTVGSLQLNGDLNLNHHVTAGGSSPGRSNGPALGSGGTASLGGSDTSGSITINTGGSPAAGCFITVTFASKFNSTPHVLITPVGSAAAGLSYYINRSTSNFSICSTNAAPGNTTFGFDYFILD